MLLCMLLNQPAASEGTANAFYHTLDKADPYWTHEENIRSHAGNLEPLLQRYEHRCQKAGSAENYYVLLRVCYQTVLDYKQALAERSRAGDKVPASHFQEGERLKTRFRKWGETAHSRFPLDAHIAELNGDALYHSGYFAAAAAQHYRAVLCGRDVRLLHEKLMLDFDLICINLGLKGIPTGRDRGMFLYGTRDSLTEKDLAVAQALCLYYEGRAMESAGAGFPNSRNLHDSITGRTKRPEGYHTLVATGQENLARYMLDDPMTWEKRRAEKKLHEGLSERWEKNALKRQEAQRSADIETFLQELARLEDGPNTSDEIVSIVSKVGKYGTYLRGKYDHIPNRDKLVEKIGQFEAEVCDLYYCWYTRTTNPRVLQARVNEMLVEHRGDERLLLLKVEISYSIGDLDTAMEAAKEILAVDPDHLRASAWVIRIRAESNDQPE